MSTRKLKFTAKFMKETSLNFYVSHAKDFFNNIKYEKFSYTIVTESVRQCTEGYNCDSSLYEIVFTFDCKNVKRDSDLTNFCFFIQKQWCSEAKKSEYLHWLIPDAKNIISSNYNNQYGNAKASVFSFGTIPTMKTFVRQYKFSQKLWISTILCSFSHLQRHFSLFISNLHTPECHLKGEMGHKIVIHYDSLIRIIANMDSSKEEAELFFHMEHPPLIYVSHASPGIENSNEVDKLFNSNISKAKELEYGCDKFERAFDLGCSCNNTHCTTKRIGRCPVLKLCIQDKFQTRWLIEQLIHKCSKKTEICFTSLETTKLTYDLVELKKFPWIPNKENTSEVEEFNCEYAWKVVHSRSLCVKHEIVLKNQMVVNYSNNLIQSLSLYAQKNATAVAKALYFISDMIDKGIIFPFKSTFEKKFEHFCSLVTLNSLPKGMCYVRRVILTPSRFLHLQPYEHFDNRIIRQFGVEYMLRVSVQDDNFSKLTFAVQYNSNKEKMVEKVVEKVLSSGIVIGSRRYHVLASSSSQLREHGLWLYAKDSQNNTASTIRKWMGDFSAIKNVAKYMARMGQCLSSTEEAVQINLSNGCEIPLDDIVSPDGRYTFSDGIGMISTSLTNEIRSVLIQNKNFAIEERLCYHPMAFQIRYKGCKGMVAENPRLRWRTIGIRPSMKKFECDTSDQLEIVKTSAPRRLFLNKHLITILEQMGIPKETFLDLQSDMMLNLLDSLVDENFAAFLLSHNLTINFPFRNLLSAGFSLTTEPFFRSLLLAFFKASVAKLQSSMRIAVPEKYGRNMLGILDETGLLKYGQVFIQYTESTHLPNSPLKILDGPVLVTKNPSLHPGDVRRLVAVNVPQLRNLHHVKDCIVFPACGKRPHPDEMAGSDLDGDEYVVIWHKDLIFKRDNVKPMEYPVYKEVPLSHEIQVSDMVKFFCHYIQNDCIGAFAHAHLVWADKLEDGIFSRRCMEIAKRYPYVLDFAKHGTTKYLKKSERPDVYPDFMQKGLSGNSYHSKNALGSLYRASRVLDACSSKINLSVQSSTFDADLEYPGWEIYKSSAKKHLHNYSNMILEVLNKYSLKSEAEAFSGFVELEMSKKWRQESTNTIKVVKCYIENIMFTFRNIFFQELKKEIEELNLDENESKIRKYQRASAWYMCLYGQTATKVLSFPWVLSNILVEIKSQRSSSHVRNFLVDIDLDLLHCTSSVAFENNSLCFCKRILEIIVTTWLSKSGLNIWSKGNSLSCQNCCKRIFLYFQSIFPEVCCSSSPELCRCDKSCSPTKLVLKFLRFFVKKTEESLGNCDENCNGFLPRNLQELSLQTLAYLIITRNIKYLGFQFDTTNYTKNAVSSDKAESLYVEEGDPIKIPVKTNLLKEIIEEHLDEVISYLQKKSGVKHIVLRPEADLHDNFCLIVNSVGRSFERWNLEAILLDPDLTNNLKIALNI